MSPDGVYQRYKVGTEPAPDVVRPPPRFRVRVSKLRLATLVVRSELSRPCSRARISLAGWQRAGLRPQAAACIGDG
jgi:hypothetical protein